MLTTLPCSADRVRHRIKDRRDFVTPFGIVDDERLTHLGARDRDVRRPLHMRLEVLSRRRMHRVTDRASLLDGVASLLVDRVVRR